MHIKGRNKIITIVPVACDILRKKIQKVTKNTTKLKKGNRSLKCTHIYFEYLKTSLATKDMISKRQVEIERNY